MRTKNTQFSGLFLVPVLLIMFVLTPAADAAGSAAPPPPGGKHVVRAGDTLWDIANRYELTVAQLTAANPGVSPDSLHVGRTLSIPSKTSSVPSASSGAPATEGGVYTVKPNDTLWDIASKHGLFVNDLIGANPGVDPQRLMAGQVLLIQARSFPEPMPRRFARPSRWRRNTPSGRTTRSGTSQPTTAFQSMICSPPIPGWIPDA